MKRTTTTTNKKDLGCYNHEKSVTVRLPKKLLTSKQWKIRNDSSQLNAVLHPEDHGTPMMKHSEKIRGNVTKKCCLSSNNCYCREKDNIPRPSLIPRPTSCISKSTMGKKLSIQDLKKSCVCVGKGQPRDILSLRDRISKIKQDRRHQYDLNLEYSNQRLDYEQYREEQEDKYLQEVEAYKEKEKFLEQKSKESGVDISENEYYIDEDGRKRRFEATSDNDVNTILGTQRYGTQTSTFHSGSIDRDLSKNTRSNDFKFASEFENSDLFDKDFEHPMYERENLSSEFGNYYRYKPQTRVEQTQSQDIPEFRNKHFFETHNIGRLGSTEDHTCIHQFILDDRMLPAPLNKDVFGRSLCKICEKPMEGACNLDKSSLGSFSKSNYSRLKNLMKCSEYGLSPKLIHIGSGKSQIELILGKNDLDALSTLVHTLKRTEFCNSLALRHQRMRLI